MITPRLQIFALLLGIVFMGMLIELIREKRVELKYALLWLFSGVVMLALAAFPGILDWFSGLIGVYEPVNALFAIMLCCGLALMISFSVIMSGNKRATVRLTQEISLLEQRVRELEAKTGTAPDAGSGAPGDADGPGGAEEKKA